MVGSGKMQFLPGRRHLHSNRALENSWRFTVCDRGEVFSPLCREGRSICRARSILSSFFPCPRENAAGNVTQRRRFGKLTAKTRQGSRCLAVHGRNINTTKKRWQSSMKVMNREPEQQPFDGFATNVWSFNLKAFFPETDTILTCSNTKGSWLVLLLY